MPPKLITNDKKLIVIRPLAYCQEIDIARYAARQKFPITPKGLCGVKESYSRKWVGQLIKNLSETNTKIPSNILHALGKVSVSQLMDLKLWDFKNLEKSLQ